LGVYDSVLGVPGELINFPVSGGFQGFFFSFSPIVFILDVFSGILKILQGDVSLFGILLTIDCLSGSEV